MSNPGISATRTDNVQDARKNLTKLLKALNSAPEEELQKSAAKIYAEAVALAPYKTGKLERAVYVRVSRSKRTVGLVAGASARSPKGYNYAGIQHEDTSFKHPVKGKAHFISEPFNAEVPKLLRRIKRRLKIKNGS